MPKNAAWRSHWGTKKLPLGGEACASLGKSASGGDNPSGKKSGEEKQTQAFQIYEWRRRKCAYGVAPASSWQGRERGAAVATPWLKKGSHQKPTERLGTPSAKNEPFEFPPIKIYGEKEMGRKKPQTLAIRAKAPAP